jgi:hypothetical protein
MDLNVGSNINLNISSDLFFFQLHVKNKEKV